MIYKGRNRRVHTVYITNNREYHTRSGVCIAVRDKKTTIWITGHEAIGMQLKCTYPHECLLGEKLCFLSPRAAVQTSVVRNILRPGTQTYNTYMMVDSVGCA